MIDRLVVSCLLLILSHGFAAACSCARPGERSVVAFDGQVLQTEIVSGPPDIVRATVKVGKIHKGNVPSVVVLRTYRHDFICGAGEELRRAEAGARMVRFELADRAVSDWSAMWEGQTAISICEVETRR